MKLVGSLLIGARNGRLNWNEVKYCSEKCRRERKAGLYIGSLEKTRKGNLSKTTGGESFKPLSGNTISAADDTSKKVLIVL